MKITKICVAASFVFCGAVEQVQAAPFPLGMTFQRLRAEYPAARVDQNNHPKVLDLKHQEWDGVSWRAIRFQFDAADQLSAVTLEADVAEQSNVRALVSKELQHQNNEQSIALDIPEDVEMRLCENSLTGFTLTFKRPSYAL